MQIQVNGKPTTLAENSSLSNLISQLALGGAKIAVEMNREIVPRSEYDHRILNEGDVVEIVQAIGGG